MRWLGLGPRGTKPPARGKKTTAPTKGRGRSTTSRRRTASRRPDWAGMGRTLRLAGVLVAVVTVSAGAAWVWQSGMIGRQIDATAAALERFASRGGLVVRSVTVEGRARTGRARLLAALGTGRGEPILNFDPQTARARVEALPWVLSARVERRLPDAIHVVLTEREPLALWQRAPETYAVIDRMGTPLNVDASPFGALPVIVGRDAPPAVPGLLAMLATEPDLLGRVRAATFVGGRRWTLHLDSFGADAIDVRLPEQQPLVAWRRLAELNREGRLLALDIDMVDLRLPDRLVVRPRVPLETGPGMPSTPSDARRVPVSGPAQDT
ncbi:cell division protein FtsQ/DivIB [Roseospira navarrensis]|uniref:Cell division protein FtsQ n=1 Tax=Roseospira navarrensis TaxID=140058 RepID=A0A7X2D3F0_9PROT|nr:FtsQ-type POTRA domain-containing protein [Roseospira navarrensis]MQX36743.1 FtsQ-type POTRA domain-containing protein [Roseospira navarrensis]